MPTLHCEAWKDIPKWEGLYQASTLGRVKSVDRLDCREHNLHQSNMVQVAKGNPKHNQHKGFICREVL